MRRRTIAELITIVFAGESETLTHEERVRLLRRRRLQRHWPYLLRGFSPATAVEHMRADILRDLRHYTLAQCRYRIRELLHLLTEFASAWDGQLRRVRAQQARGGKIEAQRRRAENAKLVSQIADERGRITKAAVRRHLKAEAEKALKEGQHAPWLSATKAEQDLEVANLAHSLRRARKNRGH